ncbi:MAG: hypothetical protein IJ743_00390 [Bacilli bacterium]|nr:hypothetical protein [Bacilli bacterium]
MKAKYPLSKVEPTHRKWTILDTIEDLWLTNKGLFGVIIVLVCVSILMYLIGYAAATGHIHLLSTEANVYEHLSEVI